MDIIFVNCNKNYEKKDNHLFNFLRLIFTNIPFLL